METTCACETCINMCRTRVCWGTPEDALKLIKAGFGNRLMNDYWLGGRYDDGYSDISLLCPASTGYDGLMAPEERKLLGPCVFLTSEGMCELHTLGLKPTECRLAIHQMGSGDIDTNHRDAAMSWNNEEAQRLVYDWWSDHNLTGRFK